VFLSRNPACTYTFYSAFPLQLLVSCISLSCIPAAMLNLVRRLKYYASYKFTLSFLNETNKEISCEKVVKYFKVVSNNEMCVCSH